MNKELHELKGQFEKEIPTSFTAHDRRAIRNRINQPETKRDIRHIFPKAITAMVFAAVMFVGVMIANDQIEFITDGDMPAPGPQNSDQLTADPHVKEEPLLIHFTKKREYDSLTFDPKTLRPGDVVGDDTTDAMKMVDRTMVDGKSVFTFVGVMELTGELYRRAGELQFIPNMESVQQLPVAREDLGDLVNAGLLNEDVVRKIFGIGPSFESTGEVSLVIERVEYRYSEEESIINFGVRKAVSAEDEMDFPRETYETSIQLSDELLKTYKAYAESLDDKLLEGLKPIDVFKMYFHARNQGHKKVVYALYIKGDTHGTPDKETYFNDPGFSETEAGKQNFKEFYQLLSEVNLFEEIYMEKGEAIIAFKIGNRTDRPMFRFVKDQQLNVWKVGWMPMQ